MASGSPALNDPAMADQLVDGDDTAVDQREAEREQFRTSRFDVVTSLFAALIAFLGIFATMLLIIWLTSQWEWGPGPMPPIEENAAGRGDNPPGFERDFEPPGEEEVEDLLEPTLADTIEAVTEAVSSVAASLVAADTDSAVSSEGTGGAGDARQAGPEGEGDDIVPRFERWQLEFEATDKGAYAKQLDEYKIELGAMGGGIKDVEIVSNLSRAPKKSVLADPKSEKRLYFMFTRPTPLQRFDQDLLQAGGAQINSKRIVMKFIPKELENYLANIELEYAKNKGHDHINQFAKTVFKSVKDGNGHKFVVTSQRYRKPRW